MILAVAGCASTPPAPVVDRSLGGGSRAERESRHSRATPATGNYRVQRGDTLYSIAFRHGLDYRDLARINRIGPPYTIYVGQKISLDGRGRSESVTASARPDPVRRPPVVQAPQRTPPREVAAVRKPAPATGTVPTPKPPSAPPDRASPPERVAPSTSPGADAVASQAGISWRWPASGARAGAFVAGDQTRQGIDIAGKSGDPVRAAADGVVVYSGNGLIGYGELIIIKHNAEMLSAYGHNRRRLVQEGDRIKSGQQIAEMGSSSASRDMLHFEIRRNGKPVDPLAYLPKR